MDTGRPRRFSTALRGYNPIEVDRYLESLAAQLNELTTERAELTGELARLRAELEASRSLVGELSTGEEAYGDRVRAIELLIASAAREILDRGGSLAPSFPAPGPQPWQEPQADEEAAGELLVAGDEDLERAEAELLGHEEAFVEAASEPTDTVAMAALSQDDDLETERPDAGWIIELTKEQDAELEDVLQVVEHAPVAAPGVEEPDDEPDDTTISDELEQLLQQVSEDAEPTRGAWSPPDRVDQDDQDDQGVHDIGTEDTDP